jgi:hypothetical protein
VKAKGAGPLSGTLEIPSRESRAPRRAHGPDATGWLRNRHFPPAITDTCSLAATAISYQALWSHWSGWNNLSLFSHPAKERQGAPRNRLDDPHYLAILNLKLEQHESLAEELHLMKSALE